MIDATMLAAINADPALRRWSRHMEADVLLEIGAETWRWVVRDGTLASVTAGPFVMPAWTVALRAEPEAWAIFMRPEPTPGYHDLMALVRRGALRVEGDLRPFMQHLFWFKAVFAKLREPKLQERAA
ncbi:hypothetical protein [Acidisphaera sp. L21]|jgi:hypothetical protein|uniref:hypothetical protein n=1 Tax=Acidisphaera sp. L21 TaxID=1641851 RepID=UPI00131D02D1|nr:hypothetical protein [Acidisphaera sp. L21]